MHRLYGIPRTPATLENDRTTLCTVEMVVPFVSNRCVVCGLGAKSVWHANIIVGARYVALVKGRRSAYSGRIGCKGAGNRKKGICRLAGPKEESPPFSF